MAGRIERAQHAAEGDPALDELKQAYLSGELILVAGAGVRAAAGLPTGAELVARLTEHARSRGATAAAVQEIANLAARRRIAEALAATRACLGGVEFTAMVMHHLDDQGVTVPEVATTIAALAPNLRGLITTNVDHLLERALGGAWPPVARALCDVAQRRRIILKAHGTLLDRSTWILTREDYDRAMYSDPALRSVLAAMFRACTLLFVGYAPDDDDFQHILASVQSLPSDQPPRHFAFAALGATQGYDRAQVERAGVRIIEYKNADGTHAEVTRLLRGLVSAVAEHERPAGPSLRPGPLPSYADAASRALSDQVAAARSRRAQLQSRGFNTFEVDREILDLRRRLREGGQLRPGDALSGDRYLLLDHVGQGGFGSVWRAHDRERDEIVAIKVLHANLAGDQVRRDRFFRGARIMADLDHTAVVRVLDGHGEDGGYYYFVMEFISGGDLRRVVLDGKLDAVFPVILAIGQALAKAHARGFVHRDVKPANVLVDGSGSPRLTDFDLVGAADTTGGTRSGALGTFLYAAPELMSHPQDASARADVYGLGMTTIFCLHGNDLPIDLVQHPKSFIDGLPCSTAVKAVMRRAIQWDEKKRFSDAGAFCEAFLNLVKPSWSASGWPSGVRLSRARRSVACRSRRQNFRRCQALRERAGGALDGGYDNR